MFYIQSIDLYLYLIFRQNYLRSVRKAHNKFDSKLSKHIYYSIIHPSILYKNLGRSDSFRVASPSFMAAISQHPIQNHAEFILLFYYKIKNYFLSPTSPPKLVKLIIIAITPNIKLNTKNITLRRSPLSK